MAFRQNRLIFCLPIFLRYCMVDQDCKVTTSHYGEVMPPTLCHDYQRIWYHCRFVLSLGMRLRPHKVNSCFWSKCGQFSLSYLTYVIRCNQYSACNHSVYTTCTQWLHHPSLYILAPSLDTQVLSPGLTLHDPFLLICTAFSFNFGYQKKKERLVA